MTGEKIPHCSTRHAEERTSRKTVEETGNDHSLDVLRNGARDQPDQEKGKRYDVDVSPSIKLDLVSMACVCRHGSKITREHTSDRGLRNNGPTPVYPKVSKHSQSQRDHRSTHQDQR